MRLFVAIVPPLDIQRRIAGVQEKLQQSGADVKWVETENLHLTLKFLGNVVPDLLEGIQEALRRVARQSSAFTVRFRGTGVFPPRGTARVIWVGMQGSEQQLRTLQAEVESSLQPLGFARENRSFSAHVTLGRVRSSRQLEPCVQTLRTLHDWDGGELLVNRFSLMESKLSSSGPAYSRVQDFALGTTT